MSRTRSDISIHYPLSTSHYPLIFKDHRLPRPRSEQACKPAVLPSSGHRDTKPLVTSVRTGAPSSVKPVTCLSDVILGRKAGV